MSGCACEASALCEWLGTGARIIVGVSQTAIREYIRCKATRPTKRPFPWFAFADHLGNGGWILTLCGTAQTPGRDFSSRARQRDFRSRARPLDVHHLDHHHHHHMFPLDNIDVNNRVFFLTKRCAPKS